MADAEPPSEPSMLQEVIAGPSQVKAGRKRATLPQVSQQDPSAKVSKASQRAESRRQRALDREFARAQKEAAKKATVQPQNQGTPP